MLVEHPERSALRVGGAGQHRQRQIHHPLAVHHQELGHVQLLPLAQAVLHRVVDAHRAGVAHHDVPDPQAVHVEVVLVLVLRPEDEVLEPQEVGAGHQAARPAPPVDHRQGLDPVLVQEPARLGDQRVAGDGHRVALHPVADDHGLAPRAPVQPTAWARSPR